MTLQQAHCIELKHNGFIGFMKLVGTYFISYIRIFGGFKWILCWLPRNDAVDILYSRGVVMMHDLLQMYFAIFYLKRFVLLTLQGGLPNEIHRSF